MPMPMPMPMPVPWTLQMTFAMRLRDGRYLIPPEAMLSYAGMTFPQISAQAVSSWWRAQCGSCDRGGSGRINGNLYL